MSHNMKRKVVAILEIDDDIAIHSRMGTLDYLENRFELMRRSGVELVEARILDEDDEYDAEAIALTNKIFEA